MLGKIVSVRVTNPVGSKDDATGLRYRMNFGEGTVTGEADRTPVQCYIIGITHPVKKFEGRIVASVRRNDGSRVYVAAGKKMRFINCDIVPLLEPIEKRNSYHMTCLYEKSCGAAVYRIINGEPRFLLIKNKRSANWGFPKGHMEMGETREQTAKREVFEETGIRIHLIEGFFSESDYKIGNRIQKNVVIFLAMTRDTQTRIQRDEVEDYAWLTYPKTLERLNFENDKVILNEVCAYMKDVIGVNIND